MKTTPRSRLNGAFTALALSALIQGTGCDAGETGSGAGSIDVGITGEEAVQDGLPFTKMPSAEQIVLVDGWSIKFERWLTSVENIRLSEPGKDPAQQQIIGETVALQPGPWVINLTRQEKAPLASFAAKMDGKPFDTTVRYAFSFDLTPVKTGAKRVSLDASDEAALAEMQQRGWSNYVEVTATHDPYDAMDDMSFRDYPTKVRFKLGWGGTASYINCSNPDNGSDEQANRGVQPAQGAKKNADIYIHIEHPFWEQLNVENPPARFDAIAARATTKMEAGQLVGDVGMDDLAGVSISRLVNKAGADVKDRTVPGLIQNYVRKAGALAYNPNGATVSDLKGFVIYSAQSMAHLNGEGICYVQRK